MLLNNIIIIFQEQLDDYVRNKAKPGDVLISRNKYTDEQYMYFCNKDNIGKYAMPRWVSGKLVNKFILEAQFKDMTLEEKVDFLIDEYIKNNT